jgi:hypothetical protein
MSETEISSWVVRAHFNILAIIEAAARRASRRYPGQTGRFLWTISSPESPSQNSGDQVIFLIWAASRYLQTR